MTPMTVANQIGYTHSFEYGYSKDQQCGVPFSEQHQYHHPTPTPTAAASPVYGNPSQYWGVANVPAPDMVEEKVRNAHLAMEDMAAMLRYLRDHVGTVYGPPPPNTTTFQGHAQPATHK